ncbi:4749_t:CDS:2 [Paraglomus occultum]|uniref:4749_t:CDS:1 n=1 Tax=Paraglomus occultum TaxID=144539 RepID=A0A9N8ZVX7_9GLOM|nr:4749_t:CDS:2 [Paraglomus occultum]
MTAHALPHEGHSHLSKRCSFFNELIGNCDDGVDFGGNCSVLPCKDGLVCKNDLITGTPTCTTDS